MAGRFAGLLKQLGDFKEGFKHDYAIGGEDARQGMYRERELRNLQQEGPKMVLMGGAYPLGQRIREFAGIATPEGVQARKELDLGLAKDKSGAYQAGQMGGTVAADLTQDATRRFYWLLNAAQATGEVINEGVLAMANNASKIAPSLYGRKDVINPNTGGALSPKNKALALEMGVARMQDGKLVPKRGYSVTGQGDDAKFVERNFKAGDLQALAIPSGIAINTGLGLLSPFGGAEGYKAAVPSDEDPTKTENVLSEVALKYFMGRTGNLLPYEEFSKVRPDVSRDEYNRYQAFKYDKNTDLNPMDGDITLPGGIIKTTDEGIHGPELQFLGRSLPVTTGIIPFASAVAGGASGVMTKRPVKQGLIRGLAGLAAGQIGGNLIEGERRRRNKEDNERDTMGQYGRES